MGASYLYRRAARQWGRGDDGAVHLPQEYANAASAPFAQMRPQEGHRVQYQGPTTGRRPVYDGRFNMTARRPISEENVER